MISLRASEILISSRTGYGDTFTVTGSEAIPLATTTSEYWPADIGRNGDVVLTVAEPVATPMVEWCEVGR